MRPNHKGVHISVLGQFGVGLFEFVDLLGVEYMDFPGILAQLPVLAEGIDQAVSIDGSGLHANHHALQSLGLDRRHDPLCQQFSTATAVLHPETAVLLAIRFHQVHRVVLASHINANE